MLLASRRKVARLQGVSGIEKRTRGSRLVRSQEDERQYRKNPEEDRRRSRTG
jgi:hypothetical protein